MCQVIVVLIRRRNECLYAVAVAPQSAVTT